MTDRLSLSLRGLIAATYTPLQQDGSLDLAKIPPMVDYLVRQRISGLYVLGSTGEGVSMTFDERCAVAEAFVQASAGRIPVIIQVGSESLWQAQQLARHAQQVGADAVSAVCPVYFKPDSVTNLVESMAVIASGADSIPFYYYHIPVVTGVALNMTEFLRLGSEKIPTLRGIKLTSHNVFEFQSCLEFAGDRFEILWGFDEMLMFGLAAGAKAAVGSTYNFAAPIYHRLMQALSEGDVDRARQEQSRSQALVRTFIPYGPRGSQKAIMSMVAVDCGPTRLPVKWLSDEKIESLKRELTEIGFFDWIKE